MIQPDPPYPLRSPCPDCGSESGRVEERNGQACIWCLSCSRFLYNAPKKERGLAPDTTRTDGISPSLRQRVAYRANFQCELCGATERVMHVGHLVSEYDLRTSGLPPEAVRNFDNLAWCCDQCNLGMGRQSLPLHQALVFLWRRSRGA